MIYFGLCRLCKRFYLYISNDKKIICTLCKKCQPPKLVRI